MAQVDIVTTERKEQTHFQRIDALGGVDMLQARYYKQRFARHVHDTFALVLSIREPSDFTAPGQNTLHRAEISS